MGLKIWRSWDQRSRKPIGSWEPCAEKQIESPRGSAAEAFLYFSDFKFWLYLLICDFCCGVRILGQILAGVGIRANFGTNWLVCELAHWCAKKKTMLVTSCK